MQSPHTLYLYCISTNGREALGVNEDRPYILSLYMLIYFEFMGFHQDATSNCGVIRKEVKAPSRPHNIVNEVGKP